MAPPTNTAFLVGSMPAIGQPQVFGSTSSSASAQAIRASAPRPAVAEVPNDVASSAPSAALAVAAVAALQLAAARRHRRSRQQKGGRCVSLGAAAAQSHSLFGALPAVPSAAVASKGSFPAPDGGAKPMPNGKTAVVVGAGVGGLALAGRLARAGFKVTLLEKNDTLGGRMRSEEFGSTGLEGHRFDTGPSLLLFPDKYRECFAALGAKLEDHVTIARVEPTAMRVHYAEDWSTLDLLYDSEAMRRQLEEVEPGSGPKYFRWLGEARASLDLGLKAFIEQDSTSALDFVDLTRVGPLALAVNPVLLLGPQTWQLATHFKTEKVKALFSYQHLYVGLRPQNAPGVFSLLAATELTDGIWYPVGGFATVRDGLQRLAEAHGVNIRTGVEVSSILVDETGSASAEAGSLRTARGVTLSTGEEISADVVVANPDLPYVYEELLKGQYAGVEEEASKISNDLEYSCSIIEFCWALKGPLPKLTQHNVFLGNDYDGSWDRPCTVTDFRDRHSFNFYVHRPTYTDGSAAPEGEDNVMIEFPIGNELERRAAAKKTGLPMDSDDDLVAAAREAAISQFERMGYGAADGGGMKALIKGERVVTPTDWERRYNVKHGSAFGLSHGLLQLACFRPPRQTGIPTLDAAKVDNLYFVGASTRPGNGVPLVMMGVAVAFDNIIAEQGVARGPQSLPLEPMSSGAFPGPKGSWSSAPTASASHAAAAVSAAKASASSSGVPAGSAATPEEKAVAAA